MRRDGCVWGVRGGDSCNVMRLSYRKTAKDGGIVQCSDCSNANEYGITAAISFRWCGTYQCGTAWSGGKVKSKYSLGASLLSPFI